MTLHRFTTEEKNAAGQVIRRRYRYVERRGGSVSAVPQERPAPRPPAEALRAAPLASPSEEIDLVKDIRKDIAALQERLRAVETMPRVTEDAAARAHSKELAGVVQEGFSRLDAKLATLEMRLEHMKDHEPRLRKIEAALGTYAAMAGVVLSEDAAA